MMIVVVVAVTGAKRGTTHVEKSQRPGDVPCQHSLQNQYQYGSYLPPIWIEDRPNRCCRLRLSLLEIIILMAEQLSQRQMLIMSSILLSFDSIVLVIGLIRIMMTGGKNKSFLLKFFGVVSIIAAIEVGLQAYQVFLQSNDRKISIPTLLSINVYAMAFEAAAMFILSDYWGQTSEILTKQSTEQQISTEKHWIRLTILAVWAICFSVFIGFAFDSKDIQAGDLQYSILVLGCQGLGVVLALWANILQIIKGYRMSTALGRYEEWVSSLPIRKLRFCLLYWLSSVFNIVRSLFLIGIAVWLQLSEDSNNSSQTWLFVYVYSFSNVPILLIYLMGFSANSEEIQLETMLLEDSRSSGRSRRQTELAPSRSSKSIEN